MVRRRDHALADGDARAGRHASSKCSGDIDEPGVDTQIIIRKYGIPDAHSRGGGRRGAAPRRRGQASRTSRAAPTSGRSRRSPSTASTRATSTTRSRSSGCRTATTGSACTSPTSRTTCKEGSALDEEAYERGTSVYFPERAVHMFPSELATGLCSLNPHVDRLVQSCLMEVDRRGNVVRYEMHDGVINSDARMTYTAVNAILTDRRRGRRSRSTATLVPMFELMRELFEILQRAPPAARLDRLRSARGGSGARREDGEIEAIVAVRAQRRAPADRRVHAAGQRDRGRRISSSTTCRRCTACTSRPTSKKVEEFEAFITRSATASARTGTRVQAEALPEADRPDARHARGAADRGADAADDAEGALRRGEPRPLRPGGRALHALHVADPPLSRPGRAPHAARVAARRDRPTARREELDEELPETARHTSEMERRADEAERELLQWKKVRFMADKVGDEFDGYITGVAPFGLFVELIEHYVEGLVHISSMADDYYRFVEQQHIAARREHEEGLPARRQGAGAGGARGHGAPADRSRAGGDSRDGAARERAARRRSQQGEAEEGAAPGAAARREPGTDDERQAGASARRRARNAMSSRCLPWSRP